MDVGIYVIVSSHVLVSTILVLVFTIPAALWPFVFLVVSSGAWGMEISFHHKEHKDHKV